jgi:hypothetical protein
MGSKMSNLDVLNYIPITPWVLGTVERVISKGFDDAKTWNQCWYEQYKILGGARETTGNKPCPRAAARGLWYLGLLRDGSRPLISLSIVDIYQTLSKNAAYAVIAMGILEKNPYITVSDLWPLVQAEFTRHTGGVPAASEQGEIRLVIGLFRNGALVSSNK